MKTKIIKTIPIAAAAALLLALGACSNMLTDLEQSDSNVAGLEIKGPVYDQSNPSQRHTYSSTQLENANKIQAIVPTSSSSAKLAEQELPAQGEVYELDMTAGTLAADKLIYTAEDLANNPDNDFSSFYDIKKSFDLSEDIPVSNAATGLNFARVSDGNAGFMLFSYNDDQKMDATAFWFYSDGAAEIGGPGYTQAVGSPSGTSYTSDAEVSVHVKLEEGWNRVVFEYTWNAAGDTVQSASVTTDSQRELDWYFYSP